MRTIKTITMTPSLEAGLEEALAWLSGRGWVHAERIAEEFGNQTGREMYEPDPARSYKKWKDRGQGPSE